MNRPSTAGLHIFLVGVGPASLSAVMADSDGDYEDEDVVMAGAATSSAKGHLMASRPKGREKAKWEAGAARTWQLPQAATGESEVVLSGIEEAEKRRRYV